MTENAPEPKVERPGGSALFQPEPLRNRLGPADVIAAALSLLWLAMVGGFFLMSDPTTGTSGALGIMMVLVAIFLPIAMIWVTAITARTTRDIRDEAQRLQVALDAMRQSYVSQMQGGAARQLPPTRPAERITPEQLPSFTSRREHTGTPQPVMSSPVPPLPTADDQPALALGNPAEPLTEPVSVVDFIRAMNFPDDEHDAEGFRALRRALDDRDVAKLIRAAQDVLTLLSHDGIFMDDLAPDRARPEIWRKFAQGDRGRAIAALGGIRDRSSLALTSGRMRQDTVFRDAAHHFLRQFDRSFSAFEANASDQDVAELADTRTAKAFMLLGRVAGTFD